jgi:hypothetical protein
MRAQLRMASKPNRNALLPQSRGINRQDDGLRFVIEVSPHFATAASRSRSGET